MNYSGTVFLIGIFLLTQSACANEKVGFSSCTAAAKDEMAEVFARNVSSIDLLFIKSRPKDFSYEFWETEWCDKDRYVEMIDKRYYPCHCVFNCVTLGNIGWAWVCHVRLPQEVNFDELQLSAKRGLYQPSLRFPTVPLLSFSTRRENDAFCLVGALGFAVEGVGENESTSTLTNLSKDVSALKRLADKSNRSHPPITLTRQEATEFVYATALCKGKVKSAKEFNELYRDDNLGFIVELKSDRCETEFGRMLMAAAEKKGLASSPRPLKSHEQINGIRVDRVSEDKDAGTGEDKRRARRIK